MKIALGVFVSLVIVFSLFGAAQVQAVQTQAAPATSKELCEQKVDNYVLNDRILEWDTLVTRDITSEELATLRSVHLSQCMLTKQELTSYWDDKSEAERSAFFTNYDRIKGIVTQDIFDNLFPKRQPVYTRESFLKSAVAFPMLCGEDGETDETCKREFATMFAHWLQETSGLQSLSECGNEQTGCTEYLDTGGYFYNPEGQEATPLGKYQYSGRGPKQLSWNGNYGRFGWNFLGDSSKSMIFNENPSLLLDDAFIDFSFMSAFWFYMTPISQKPSMHQVVTGLWEPNAKDEAAGITPGFGATIDIINGAIDCGKPASDEVQNRMNFYQGGVAQNEYTDGTLAAFGLTPKADEKVGCESMQAYPLGGTATYPLYFHLNAWHECQMSATENVFTSYDQSAMTAYGNTLCENGYDCCKKVYAKLTDEEPSFPLQLDEFVKWMGGTPINMQANGEDIELTVEAGTPITLTLDVDAEDTAGESVDWFVAAKSLSDGSWYYYDARKGEKRWYKSDEPVVSLQSKLVSLDADENKVRIPNPQVGEFSLYFAIDFDQDGNVSLDDMEVDRIKLNVLPQ